MSDKDSNSDAIAEVDTPQGDDSTPNYIDDVNNGDDIASENPSNGSQNDNEKNGVEDPSDVKSTSDTQSNAAKSATNERSAADDGVQKVNDDAKSEKSATSEKTSEGGGGGGGRRRKKKQPDNVHKVTMTVTIAKAIPTGNRSIVGLDYFGV